MAGTATNAAKASRAVTLKHLAAALAEEHQLTKRAGEALLGDQWTTGFRIAYTPTGRELAAARESLQPLDKTPHKLELWDAGLTRSRTLLRADEVMQGGSAQACQCRFTADGKSLVYMQGVLRAQDFWILDLGSQKTRRLTTLKQSDAMRTFDITADGKSIVFDRLRDNSDLVMIDRPK